MSLFVELETYKIKTRLNSQNLPNQIIKLQNMFIESFSISVFVCRRILKTPEAVVAGLDKVFCPTFESLKKEYKIKQLKSTRFFRSGKSFKVKKDFPKKSIITKRVSESLEKKLVTLQLKTFFCFLNK